MQFLVHREECFIIIIFYDKNNREDYLQFFKILSDFFHMEYVKDQEIITNILILIFTCH